MDTKGNFLHQFLLINVGLVLISSSGVFGRSIDLPVPFIIAYRSFFAGLIMLGYCKWKGIEIGFMQAGGWKNFTGAVLLGLHWVTYFYALKYSNVAIGMLSLFIFPSLTLLLEPLILKTKFVPIHILFAVLSFVGILFLLPEFSFENDQFKGVAFGVFSAFAFAIRNILVKDQVGSSSPSLMMGSQLLIIGLILSPTLFMDGAGNWSDFIFESLGLIVLTTCIGHTIFVGSLKQFSTVSLSIISCLQPLYGIILALIFLSEIPNKNTIVGGSLIICTVLLETGRIYRMTRKEVL